MTLVRPFMRQQLINFKCSLRRKPRQHVLEISIGACPFIRAAWIKLMIAAARLPLRSDPAKSQFDLPSAHGLIWFPTALLSMGSGPVTVDRSPLPNQIGVDA